MPPQPPTFATPGLGAPAAQLHALQQLQFKAQQTFAQKSAMLLQMQAHSQNRILFDHNGHPVQAGNAKGDTDEIFNALGMGDKNARKAWGLRSFYDLAWPWDHSVEAEKRAKGLFGTQTPPYPYPPGTDLARVPKDSKGNLLDARGNFLLPEPHALSRWLLDIGMIHCQYPDLPANITRLRFLEVTAGVVGCIEALMLAGTYSNEVIVLTIKQLVEDMAKQALRSQPCAPSDMHSLLAVTAVKVMSAQVQAAALAPPALVPTHAPVAAAAAGAAARPDRFKPFPNAQRGGRNGCVNCDADDHFLGTCTKPCNTDCYNCWEAGISARHFKKDCPRKAKRKS